MDATVNNTVNVATVVNAAGLTASVVGTTDQQAAVSYTLPIAAVVSPSQSINLITVSGPQGPVGPPGSGVVNLTGQYPIFYDAGSGIVGIVSGYYATFAQLTGTSGALVAQIQAAAAGVNSVNGISGFVALAAVNPLFVSVAGQTITVSGSGLVTSGDLTRYYLASNPQQYATSGDLSATGSYLYNLITGGTGAPANLSGYITTGQADLRYYPLATNPSGYVTTGQTGQFYPSSNPQGYAPSGFVTGASGALQAQINALPTAAQLAQTGSDLYRLITGESGQGVIDYATKVALASTGQQAWLAANNNGINLSGQLALTGQTLNNKINSLSGFATGVSGYLQNQIALSSAGVVSVNGLSGQLNLVGVAGITVSPSGQTMYVSGEQWVHLTGNELITGVKTFVDMTSGLSGFAVTRDAAYYQDGMSALRVSRLTSASTEKHIMVGSASVVTSGYANTFIGASVGANEFTSVQYTLAIGSRATLSSLRTGYENTVIGDTSLQSLQIGSSNTAIGGSILHQATGANDNIVIGNYALNTMRTGDQNIVLGRGAGGSFIGPGGTQVTGILTGNRNILIGYRVSASGLHSDGFLNIGDGIFGSNMYQNTGSRIGICHNNPQFNLHVSGTAAFGETTIIKNVIRDVVSINSDSYQVAVPDVPGQRLATGQWIARSAATSDSWYKGLAWSPELHLFAAGSSSGPIMISSDGINWRLAQTTAVGPRDITWSKGLGLFVGVGGNSSRVLTSSNGISWTERTAAEANTWNAVAWSPQLGVLVAVSENGTNRAMSSTDGINWISRTIPSSAWTSVIWAPELSLFVAVGATTSPYVATSPDGINWTAQTPAESNGWTDVVWSPELGLLVAISANGTNRIMTSADGVNWTSRSAAEANQWEIIEWSPQLGIFIALARDGTNRMMFSIDGITWTAQSTPDSAAGWFCLAWSPQLGIFVGAGANGTYNVINSPSFGIPGNSFTSYGVGTSYVLTNTSAAIDFGTSDPSATIAQAGTYLLMGQAQLGYSGALATGEMAHLKIRRTSPNAADITGSFLPINLMNGTGMNFTHGTFSIPPLVYQTTGRSDILSLYGNVSSTLSAGGVIAQASGTSLIAIRLY